MLDTTTEIIHEEYTIKLGVSDRPPVDDGFWRILPARIWLQFIRASGGSWEFNRAEVSGPVINRDGSLSKRHTHCRTATYYHFTDSERWPEWVKVLIDEYLPREVMT